MLTISEMAELAGTTRRTLNFYDKSDLFHPYYVNDKGYRFYEYDQLYDLTFILALREVGLSIAEIKKFNQDDASLDLKLEKTLRQVQEQINSLTSIQQILTERIQNTKQITEKIDVPRIQKKSAKQFWCSRQSVSCTDEEIAKVYSEFYQSLNELLLVNKKESGFLTKLADCNPNDYMEATFCILKEISEPTFTKIPQLIRPEGIYATILISDNQIETGISHLQRFIHENKLQINDQLWQMNMGNTLKTKASSHLIQLEYQIQNSVDINLN